MKSILLISQFPFIFSKIIFFPFLTTGIQEFYILF